LFDLGGPGGRPASDREAERALEPSRPTYGRVLCCLSEPEKRPAGETRLRVTGCSQVISFCLSVCRGRSRTFSDQPSTRCPSHSRPYQTLPVAELHSEKRALFRKRTVPPEQCPLGHIPLPCSVRVRVRSGVSRVRVRVSRVSIRVRFMVWVRGDMSGKENIQGNVRHSTVSEAESPLNCNRRGERLVRITTTIHARSTQHIVPEFRSWWSLRAKYKIMSFETAVKK